MSSPDPKLATCSNPLVSVAMTAFNSENWLARAIDSAINQQTAFPIEIVIADDCSTDATLRVAHSYRERYPTVIRVIARSRNIGIQRNYYEAFEQCRGKYIAWVDSDDFWTDPDKLTIHVQTLESDPSRNVAGHFVRSVSTD